MCVIWALFDSETACVSKALPEHEVYSFGIGGGTEKLFWNGVKPGGNPAAATAGNGEEKENDRK
jgi:hypothetical protein